MRIILLILMGFLSLCIKAQDTIYKRTGDIIPAKISEINIKEVTYKRTDLLDGPLFISNKNEIRKIKYANGAIDSFKVVQETPKKQAVVYVNPMRSYQYANEISLSYRRGVYQYMGHHISDKAVFNIVSDKNGTWKNAEIDLNIKDSKRNKALQYTIGYGGAVVGGIGIYAAALGADVGSNSNDAAIAAFAGILSAGVVVSSQIISFKYKLKRVKHANRVAELYNQLSRN